MILQYQMNGYNIVVDVNSASVHVTDALAYDMIRLLDEMDLPDIASAIEDAALQDRLTSDVARLHEEASGEEASGEKMSDEKVPEA